MENTDLELISDFEGQNEQPETDKDTDKYAADVQNGYGYYDNEGVFHYYPNYWD
jgi:hypothetical protein